MPNIPRNSPRRAYQPERVAFEGITNRTTFYNNAPWRRFRLSFLQANPLCELCHLDHRVTPATEVHHIHAVNPDNPFDTQQGRFGLPLSESNCQALCKACHDSTTARRRAENKQKESR